MPTHFDIVAGSETLDARAGQRNVVFTVTNKTGRALRARATVRAEGGARTSWFDVVDTWEREMEVDGVHQFVVSADPPPGTPDGTYRFRLVVQDVDEPDDVFDEGQPVQLLLGQSAPLPPPPSKQFPLWAIIAGAAALVVIMSVVFFFVGRRARGEGPTGGPFLELAGGTMKGDLLLEDGVELVCPGCIDSDDVADGAVVATKVADGAVGEAKLVDGAVSEDKVADGAITASKLGVTCAEGQVLKFVGGGWSCQADVAGSGEAPPPPVAPTIAGGSCPSGQLVSGINPDGSPQCRGIESSFSCQVVSKRFTSTEGSVDCPAGTFRTGGGWELSDGNNNGYNWNDAAAHPEGSNGYRCMRNIGNGGSACYAICCSLSVK